MVDAATHDSGIAPGPVLPGAESDTPRPRAAARKAGPLARLGRRLLLSEYFVLWLMIVYFLALLPFLLTGGRIGRREGAVLLAGYCAYVTTLFL